MLITSALTMHNAKFLYELYLLIENITIHPFEEIKKLEKCLVFGILCLKNLYKLVCILHNYFTIEYLRFSIATYKMLKITIYWS